MWSQSNRKSNSGVHEGYREEEAIIQQQHHQQQYRYHHLQPQQQQVQQQNQHQQQGWGTDLELGSPLQIMETVQLWGSHLELSSPGVFDSCIIDSSWTNSSTGLDIPSSPTSSALSTRNLMRQPRQQQQQQQHQEQEQISNEASSSSISNLFNLTNITSATTAAADSCHSDALQRSNDESVGSPSGASSFSLPPVTKEHNCITSNDAETNLDSSTSGTTTTTNTGRGGGGGPTERMMEITLEELSRYFSMPITQASKELKVGLTVLKKRCREFGIPRWPHRKLKSLESLIHKSQELAKDSEGKPPNPVIHAVQELEKQKKRMEETPGLELDDRTKRFRQAIFKASYKQRRRKMEPNNMDANI